MLNETQALDAAQRLAMAARKAGADAAEAMYSGGSSTGVQVRMGRLEDVERSEGGEIALRAFVGQSSASAASSDLSDDALAELVERTVAMARLAPTDPYAGLAPQDRLAQGPLPDLDLDDGGDQNVAPALLRQAALALEDAARAVAGVSNSGGASASAGRSLWALATSHGVGVVTTGSSHSLSVSVLAGEGGGMVRDHAHHGARYHVDLETPEQVGQRAGQRAVARLNPTRLKSGAMPVVFGPRVSSGLIGHLLGAINGAAVARKASFLIDRLGEALFAPDVQVIEQPHRLRGLRSRAIDGEGIATVERTWIENGRLTGWMVNCSAARQLGIPPTGHAMRGGSGAPGIGASNIILAPGPHTPEALMADIADGFYVVELAGQGVNLLTGDYSRGATGFRIVNGQLAEAVDEVTIAGNLADMFKALVPADDLELRHGIDAPTVRIDGMTLAGA